MQLRTLQVAALEVGNTQPAGVLGTRQRHVEQAQVFSQALLVGQGDLRCVRGQRQLCVAQAVVPDQGRRLPSTGLLVQMNGK